ncbi:DUF6285 domain-containing protein [Sphingomonas lycopersici]|uniref:DUF6285 domain-containing protein n=1 Tax=Sphingomonas lycopersici TaxID=2951807 RepID=A0AA41ZFJ7_9SPHN|nr:DUF6285 domain-containing protein [Sphingomonas lycopersici]MCW6535959.1 DUF6285 domain-containing protein [Sphingomonas lycopersici]
MQDQPEPREILATVAAFLRDTVVPESRPRTAFHARVAANAIDLVSRQITLAGTSDAAERARLVQLLGEDLPLAEANEALADRIAEGAVGPATPGLMEHLLATTLAKLAVDQPTYSGYRAALADAPVAKD